MPTAPLPRSIRLPLASIDPTPPTVPSVLARPLSRGDAESAAALLPNVKALRTWQLAPAARSDTAPAQAVAAADQALLALEAADGTTIFMRADALAERVARVQPEALDDDGTVDLARFRDRDATTRGLGTWIWRRVTELSIEPDDILDAARDELEKRLREKLGGTLEDWAVAGASWVGAKALMWAIESRLAGEPGLYRWRRGEALSPNDRCLADDKRLDDLRGGGKPALVFIHGTGSHTLGSFGELAADGVWDLLGERFDGRIFGFEHRTFSESPIDNALALLKLLPNDARISVVTHSRGGLVGDLLCLSAPGEGEDKARLDKLIAAYRRKARTDEREAEDADPRLRELREAVAREEQAKLHELIGLLQTKKLKVERYVRVACPARGTALLSDNLDVFLSGLLGLMRRFGTGVTGAIAGTLASPLAAQGASIAADRALKMLARVVVEIAQKRLQPQVVPGIEAMLPEAPMGMLLGSVDCRVGIAMAVIAGDIEGGGLVKRIGVMFTDWMFFDRAQNDLVVDTASMYGGLARSAGARAIFAQGAEVNHFRYFHAATVVGKQPLARAMQDWLTADKTEALQGWTPLVAPKEAPAITRGEVEAIEKNTRPVVVYLPGIMGSQLAIGDDTIWLDPRDLAFGGLDRLAIDSGEAVVPDGVVELAYGKLERHLWANNHYVETHAYDWRLPLAQLGEQFAQRLREVLEAHSDQPIRILAHSMGGLVVRAAFAQDNSLWHDIVERPGGRLIMLGTPNHGSHLMVQTMFGLSETIRMLARVDLCNDLPDVLEIVGRFQGALDLLPAPGFVDTGDFPGAPYYDARLWERLAEINDDFWFGQNLCARPTQAALDATKASWVGINEDMSWLEQHQDRVSYVFGKAEATPCGLKENRVDGRTLGLLIVETPYGDGSVTWTSGRLPGFAAENCWLMEADHMGLTSTPKYFPQIVALLEGRAPQLKRLPVTRGAAAEVDAMRMRRAGPPPMWPSPDELAATALGGRLDPPVRRRHKSPPLFVSAKAGDLRFVQVPVLCGHYRGDPIAGAEAVIDRVLVDGALSHRQQLGIHAGELGLATVVLMPRSREERLRQTGRGAVVVGLGEMGKLSADGVTEAVRAGVLRYLMHGSDRYAEEVDAQPSASRGDGNGPIALSLATLLLGSNSASQLDIAESVRAVVLGVLTANRDFNEEAPQQRRRQAYVTRLEFVELYLDAAISAAYAVGALDESLKSELERLKARIEAMPELAYGEGIRPRLYAVAFSDYWPRLAVTDADRDESECSEECYTPKLHNPIPSEAVKRLLELYGRGDNPDGPALPIQTGLELPPVVRHARRLRCVYMGEKARSESVVQVRQPGLIEHLIDCALTGPNNTVYNPGTGFGNTLFQLLVPLEFKAAARKRPNLILLVDETTANLPWELLEADGEPLVRKTRMVRQFVTTRFRRDVVRSDGLTACVISNPSTKGYYRQFGGPNWKPTIGLDGKAGSDSLPSLGGAVGEGSAIYALLDGAGYAVVEAPPDSEACDVFAKLFAHPYRVLVVNAHGVFAKRAADGSYRSGVVLSHGLLLSAAEIGLMEFVPELVFLNCCHLAKGGVGAGGNRLAAGLARELIDMGVRCVVAAGWEVRDDAASTFAVTFFQHMVVRGAAFGEAIFEARKTTFETHGDSNTWGAYQAYGDPSFVLRTKTPEQRDDEPLSAPEELLDWINQRRLSAKVPGASAKDFKTLERRIECRLKHVPEGWEARTDVQQALGRLYGDYMPDGFEPARAAYLKAITEDSSGAAVSIAAVEQLINFEAREAERLSALGDEQSLAHAKSLARTAVGRVEAFHALAFGAAGAASARDANGKNGNMERQAIFGSAFKRQAAVLLRSNAEWGEIAAALETSRDHYRAGEGTPRSTGWNPYACINRLQLDALLTSGAAHAAGPAEIRSLVELCQAAARSRFERTCEFFDGVMPADAFLAGWLLLEQAPQSAQKRDEAVETLHRAYLDATQSLKPSSREFDSVVRQLVLLADFVGKRMPSDARASVLRQLASRLRGEPDGHEQSPNSSTSRPVDPSASGSDADDGAAKPRRTRKRRGHDKA